MAEIPHPSALNARLAFVHHDHAHCRLEVMKSAEAAMSHARLRLTPVRRRILEILLEEHKAMGAYDVLARLSSEGFANQPPLVYRALDFWVSQGFVHRIQRLNAYVACMSPGHVHNPVFLICKSCGCVGEAHEVALLHALNEMAEMVGFEVTRVNIEALGLCQVCRSAGQEGEADGIVFG